MTPDNALAAPNPACMATFVEHTNPDRTVFCAATCPFATADLCPTFKMTHETWNMDPNDPNLSLRRQELQQEVTDALQNCPGPLPKP